MNLAELLDGPPQHLRRYAPPWAADRRTICGRDLDDVAGWVSFDEGRRLIAQYGQQRSRLLFCQTCIGQQRAIARPQAWDEAPAQVVADWAQRNVWRDGPGFDETRAELLSLARLVAAHQLEFDALVAGYGSDEIRKLRRAKARR